MMMFGDVSVPEVVVAVVAEEEKGARCLRKLTKSDKLDLLNATVEAVEVLLRRGKLE